MLKGKPAINDFKQIVKDLEANAITELNFSDLELNELDSIRLVEPLKSNTSITEINLSNLTTKYTPHHISTLLRVLQESKNKTITKLNLSGNSLGPDCISLNKFIERPDHDDPVIANPYPNDGILVTFLEETTSLTELDLSNNELNDKDIELLCDALEKNKSLVGLNLSGNILSDKAIKSLGRIVADRNSQEGKPKLEITCGYAPGLITIEDSAEVPSSATSATSTGGISVRRGTGPLNLRGRSDGASSANI